jgi:DNA-binding transcriptional regulator YiaG
MPNLSQILKAEIARISRKEVRASVNPLRSANFLLKRTVAALKKKVSVLESGSKRLDAMQNVLQEKTNESTIAQGADAKIRVTSRTIKALRNKLGLSQDSFALLLGVSGQSVYVMERKGGRLRLRSATLTKLLALRGIGKREAARRVEEMGPVAKKPKKRKK